MKRLILLLLLAALPLLSSSVMATMLLQSDFEGVGDGIPLTDQITGVGFTNAVVFHSGLSLNELEFPPHSGIAVLTDDGGPIEIMLNDPVSSFEAYFTYVLPITLTAFDILGSTVDVANSLFTENFVSSGNAPNELLSVAGVGISRIVIEGDSLGGSFVMDDMAVESTVVPAPAALPLFLSGLLVLWFKGLTERLKRLRRDFFILILAILGVQTSAYAEKGFQSITADPPTVVKDAATTVTVEAVPFDDLNFMPTSVRLHRNDGSGWVVVGTMVDDGTQGDAVGGDGTYTAQATVDQSDGAVDFRASAGYRRSFRRVNSSTATVTLVDPLSLDLDTGVTQVEMTVGDTTNLAYFLQIGNGTGFEVTANVDESVDPASGLDVSSDNPGSFSTNSTFTFNFNQVLTAKIAGTYQIQVDAEIPSNGLSDGVTVDVTVLPDELQAELLPLGAFPAAIEIGDVRDVLFTVSVVGSEGLVVNSMELDLVDETGATILQNLGAMNDGGIDGDISAGDFVFSGTASIGGDTGGLLYFRATADIAGIGTVLSPVFSMEVTSFPVGISPPLPGHVITDPDGVEMLDNELLVSFVDGTTDSEIVDIAASISGTVVGTIPGSYQIRFPGDGTFDGLFAAATTLFSGGRVDSVQSNTIGGFGAFPNDPQLGSQWSMEQIRATEAWLISKGSALIAVVDSGVDYTHEDLTGKIVKGHDYGDGDEDPMDVVGHGTQVAGAAGALANNGKGIAGVSWDSDILAISLGTTPTKANAALAIREAADKGAKVINCSFGWDTAGGFFGGKDDLKDAVDYARNKGALVVATAGNDGSTTKRYPATYANAMAIGSTTNSDNRASFSRHGSWVTMAAPGTGILLPQNGGGYATSSGTSFSAPIVTGAAAVLWSVHPTWSANQIRQRLVDSAKPLPTQDLGAGRLDLFEAIFNGDFEIGSLAEWDVTGTASVIESLGPLSPPNGEHFAFISTGPAGDNVDTTISRQFIVQPGVTELPIRFDYNFVSEEYPEYVDSIYDDSLEIVVVAPNGTTTTLAAESVNASAFSTIGGIDLPGGDDTVGETGWKKALATIPITAGSGTYRVFITDAGDDIYDSVVLIDHIELKD